MKNKFKTPLPPEEPKYPDEYLNYPTISKKLIDFLPEYFDNKGSATISWQDLNNRIERYCIDNCVEKYDIKISADIEGDHLYLPDFNITIELPNKENPAFNKQLSKYFKDKEIYKKDLERYKKEIKEYNKISKEKKIEYLEKELLKLKKI